MKIKYCLLFFLSVSFLPVLAQKKTVFSSQPIARPKLVVGIVVDQMRWDYLYRYYDRYQQGGFKRLLNEGFSCENTTIPYIPTFTACGHASIYTGSVPSVNGIAGNNWIIQNSLKTTYCTDDSLAKTVGSTSSAGEMSPRNLLTTTIGDELRLATNFRSKVIGIALKDRGAILPAGHAANAAYWFDDESGNWISSSYYMAQLPSWVNTFNGQKLAGKYLNRDWNTLYPLNTYAQSQPDDNPYEGKFKGERSSVFPHHLAQIKGKGFGTIRSTPFGNTLTLGFAKTAIKNEDLGKDDFTDLLAVSLSSTDYIGHQFSPNSVETEDTYLRLDKDLASFFSYLDQQVGKGNYTVFLTADHGAAHNSGFLKDHQVPAGFWNADATKNDLNNFLEDKYNVQDLVFSLLNYQVTFNEPVIADKKIDKQKLKQDCVDFLEKQPAIAYAVDMKEAPSAALPGIIKSRIINGYNIKRSGEIQVLLNPGWYEGHGVTGTTHGTWNPYDTHIPLVFMGWGTKHGASNRAASMTDISATIAALLHIQMPDGCIGQPISDILK